MSAKVERCAICRRLRRGVLHIKIFGAIPVPRMLEDAETEWIHGDLFRVLRHEPWCHSCATKVLDRAGEQEYVWRHATSGWPI